MERSVVIKVCGMRDSDNIRAVESLGVDLMGFIFFQKSPRNVTSTPEYLPSACRRVGVFVNESEDVIRARVSELDLDYVQLHGRESRELCRAIGAEVKVIKAISISTPQDIELAYQYEDVCDMLLFDTKCDGYGGSGERFDWSILEGYRGSTPFMLSGGLDIDSIDDMRAFSHPQLAGYDLNSRFEISPALKDVDMLEQFIKEIK